MPACNSGTLTTPDPTFCNAECYVGACGRYPSLIKLQYGPIQPAADS